MSFAALKHMHIAHKFSHLSILFFAKPAWTDNMVELYFYYLWLICRDEYRQSLIQLENLFVFICPFFLFAMTLVFEVASRRFISKNLSCNIAAGALQWLRS